MNYLPAIEDRARSRRLKWAYFEVDNLPPADALKEPAYTGAYSYTMLSSRRRLIRSSVCIPLAPGLETPTTIARDYLLEKYKRSPKASAGQIRACADGLAGVISPAYARPAKFDHGYYIDLRASYFSILNLVGWDLDYYPGRWLVHGRPCDDFPFPDNKRSRTALVSCCISPSTPPFFPRGYAWPADEPLPPTIPNPLINLQLWRLVNDVLACLTYEAVARGAVYTYIDGYIAPDRATADRLLELAKSWGLEGRIKHEGPGEVYGRGGYWFNVPKRRWPDSLDYVGIKDPPVHMAWLRKKLVNSPHMALAAKG